MNVQARLTPKVFNNMKILKITKNVILRPSSMSIYRTSHRQVTLQLIVCSNQFRNCNFKLIISHSRWFHTSWCNFWNNTRFHFFYNSKIRMTQKGRAVGKGCFRWLTREINRPKLICNNCYFFCTTWCIWNLFFERYSTFYHNLTLRYLKKGCESQVRTVLPRGVWFITYRWFSIKLFPSLGSYMHLSKFNATKRLYRNRIIWKTTSWNTTNKLFSWCRLNLLKIDKCTLEICC